MALYIDHTLLKPDATRDEILKLCEEGARYGFASVCINPVWVREAACALRGSGVKVCTVIGFPLGANAPDTKAYEARRALFDGASELDMVINIGALKSGDYALVRRDIAGVVEVAREAGSMVKVIIETALLTDEEKIKACEIARDAGADFVKTSTGFSKGGATAADIALMRKTVGSLMGVKASGGVKDLKQAQEMIRAGATRIGASVGVKIVQEALGKPAVSNSRSGY
ncbi:MAG: deoxyribose-phosphate aldolase [Acidobacteriota bacterium]